VATGGEQPGDVKVWDLTGPVEYVEAVSFGGENRDIAALCFTPDNRELLALGMGGVLRRWHCASGLVTDEKELPCSNEWLVPAATAAFSGDGRILAAVSPGDPFTPKVNVMETTSGQLWKVLEGHTAKVWHIACNRDGTRVASAAFGATKDGRFVREVKVWDTTTGRVLREEASFGERTDCLVLSPDGAWLAEGRRTLESVPGGVKAGPSAVFLSEISANAPPSPRPFDGDGVVRGLAFSSDGRFLAAARDSGTVRVWDEAGRALHERPMQGPPGLSALAFSPDGSRLAGVSRERVQVCDVASGQDMLFLTGAGPRPRDNGFNPVLAWSPDGSRLAASNWNRVVSLWEAADRDDDAVQAERRRRAAARSFVWHWDRAERAAQAGGAPFALAFHRRRLEALEPPTARLRRERADFFIRCGAWDQARADLAADFAKGIPERIGAWRDYALLLMQTDGRAEYERLRSLALQQFADSDDSAFIRQLVRSSGLTPLAAPAAATFLRAARRDREAHPKDASALDYLGLALYRTGQWEEASRFLHQSIEAQGDQGTPALAWVTLALVHLRQGHPEQAKPWLAKVDAALQSKALPPSASIAPSDWDWQSWLEVRLLRREAESPRSSTDAKGPRPDP
jgi:WD40 repeat protein